MTPDERRQHLRTILDQHNDAARTLRAASQQFREGASALNAAYEAIEASAAHIREVSDAILAANLSALALFNTDADERPK